MKKIILVLSAFLIGIVSSLASESADDILRKASRKVSASQGLAAEFNLTSGGNTIAGTLKAEGNKFCIETGTASIWYDGKTMWTYNPRSRETTVTIPTPQEVAEANPLSIVNTYSSVFTASMAKTQKAGSKTIVLTPKSKKSGYKSVHIVVPNAGAGLPTQIIVIPTSGNKITLSISKTTQGQKFASATFTYPKTRYPKAEIVDLR